MNDSANATRDDGRLLAWTALVAVSARAHRHPKATQMQPRPINSGKEA